MNVHKMSFKLQREKIKVSCLNRDNDELLKMDGGCGEAAGTWSCSGLLLALRLATH